MKLSHAILAVMLDGKEHQEAEIVGRVKHLIDPSKSTRRMVDEVQYNRRRARSRNRTDKVVLSRRAVPLEPETVSVEDAAKRMIHRTLSAMAVCSREGKKHGKRWIRNVDGNGTWQLLPEAREHLRSPRGAAGNIAHVIRDNLIAKGEMI